MLNRSSYDEKTLLRRMAEGEEEAFTFLFRQFAPQLELNISRLTKDSYATSEVLQETFIKIWLHREKLNVVNDAGAYFNRMALNECFNYLNGLARQDKIRSGVDVLSSFTESPEGKLSYKETETIIQNAINELPIQRKKIYELKNQGMNATEIAGKLGISPDYVRQAISAARGHIKGKLIQAGKLFPGLF